VISIIIGVPILSPDGEKKLLEKPFMQPFMEPFGKPTGETGTGTEAGTGTGTEEILMLGALQKTAGLQAGIIPERRG